MHLKGKSRNPYEFGVKVGLAMTLKGNLIVVPEALPAIPTTDTPWPSRLSNRPS